jgi:hypothetical protein
VEDPAGYDADGAAGEQKKGQQKSPSQLNLMSSDEQQEHSRIFKLGNKN